MNTSIHSLSHWFPVPPDPAAAAAGGATEPPPVTYTRKPVPLWQKVTKRTLAGLFWATAILVVVVAILIYVIPQAQAGAGLTVLTGSMQPAINPGDVVAVKGIKAHEVCENIAVGDVVTFMPETDDATLVTHRVIAVNTTDKGNTIGEDVKYETCTVQTKGDNNNVADAVVPARAIKGKVMYTVPWVGHVLNRIQTQTDMQTVALIVAGGLALAACWYLMPRYAKIIEPEYAI
ncbi:MAG: signal peptidase I [Promicromonosporaceae bacterium]|nr:signal peptidase I [Promicromonosporaceae bacterium]